MPEAQRHSSVQGSVWSLKEHQYSSQQFHLLCVFRFRRPEHAKNQERAWVCPLIADEQVAVFVLAPEFINPLLAHLCPECSLVRLAFTQVAIQRKCFPVHDGLLVSLAGWLVAPVAVLEPKGNLLQRLLGLLEKRHLFDDVIPFLVRRLDYEITNFPWLEHAE